MCACGKSMWADTSFARDGACVLNKSGLQSADMQPAPRLHSRKTAKENKRPKSAQIYLHA